MVKRLFRRPGAVLLGSMMLALGVPTTSWATNQVTGHATSRGALRLHFGDAELDAPAGALPGHARVTIRRTPSVFGRASMASFTFSVSKGNLRRPATLRLPLAQGYAPGSLVALAFQGSHGTWYTVPGRVGAHGTVATGHITHLSTWTGIDVEAYIVAQLTQALQPSAWASVSGACSRSDPLVTVSGAGPLQVCVSNPHGSRSNEELTLSNPTGTAFVIGSCTGGLAACNAPLIANGYNGELSPGGKYTISYNATQVTGTAKFTPSAGDTIKAKVVPVLAQLFGEIPGFVVGVGACIDKHNPTSLSLVTGVAVAVLCIFETGFGDLKIGALDLGKLGRTAEESVLKNAASKAIQNQTLASGGVITVTSEQELPPVGGTGTPEPPTTTPTKPTTPTSPTVPTTPTSYVYHVYGTCADGACGLNIRSGPGYSSYSVVGSLAEGAEANVVCQAVGETVGPSPSTGNSSNIWDKVTSGGWVSDLYLTTPNVGTWSPPIPQC